MEKRKLPIGIQNFESLRKDGYLYVDKTELIYRLVSQGRYYFLSRPRRFGKSLLMSTIKAFFLGKKELFDGTIGPRLAIAEKEDVTWEEYPVLHLDLNTQKYDTPESLNYVLDRFLREYEDLLGLPAGGEYLGPRFEIVIKTTNVKIGKKVVILVDEYDKPMLQAIGNPDLQESFRSTLKGFYGALKSMDEHIQFAFLTGVTKFGQVSVFSDLNNLNDISMSPNYWNICGISGDELKENFHEEISRLADANGMTYDKCIDALRQRYDGYHFEESVPGVYNPFSVLLTFDSNKFGNYWFETGTPSYLVYLLQEHGYNLQKMVTCPISSKKLYSKGSDTDPIPVIYQSGYLTIKDYDPRFKTYILDFPNQEVKEGFLDFLLPYYTSIKESESEFFIQSFIEDIESGNTEQFLNRLKSLFADTPYELVKDLENHYQNVLWLVSKLMGFYVHAEYHTSNGRIDMVLKSPKFCYVMEFKLDGTAEEALQQISDKNYTLPFEMGNRKVIKVGLNFDGKTRNIERFVIAIG